jgi:threonine dehydratase
MHPFESPHMVTGSATLGFEFLEDAGPLDAVIIPIGGGGLAAGMALAMKQMLPEIEVFGVEPTGADSMHRSFQARSPQSLDAVHTIADSLGAPFAMPMTYDLCRRYIDDIVHIEDDAMIEAMRILMQKLKLAVEPAGAAATAALLGPLASRLAGKRVGIIVCGANIDTASYARLVG